LILVTWTSADLLKEIGVGSVDSRDMQIGKGSAAVPIKKKSPPGIAELTADVSVPVCLCLAQ